MTVLLSPTNRRTYSYSEPQLYSQNSGGSYFDTQGSSSQVSTVVSSHGMSNNGGGGSGGMSMNLTGGQVISSSPGAYIMDNAAPHPATQTARASPATIEMAIETLQKSEGLSSQRSSLLNSHRCDPAHLALPRDPCANRSAEGLKTRVSPQLQWLLDNYETAEGVSLPRSTLYNHYLRHCQEQKLDPVNAASFGKLIRSIFMGLRTRRLGTRGNSKYHYYGIRVKPDSPLNRLQEDMQYMALRQQPVQQKQRFKPVQKFDSCSGENYSGGGQTHPGAAEQTVIAQRQHHQQFLDASRPLPDFIELELGPSNTENISPEDGKALQSLYREHCEAILDVVVNLQFSLIEKLWQTFWRYSPTDTVDGATVTENSSITEIEARLPSSQLMALCRNEAVLKWMSTCDHLMYQALVEILIPDVLRPIPSEQQSRTLQLHTFPVLMRACPFFFPVSGALTQAIRNFAKSLEGWLSNAMNAIPQPMIQTKVEEEEASTFQLSKVHPGPNQACVFPQIAAVSAFAQTLRRYTSLNHLAQAARAVLQNTSQINQMLSDLNRVDFANVQVRGARRPGRTPRPQALTLSLRVLGYRSRRPGCASARRGWSSTWSRTSRPRCSSRAPWSSGRPGWRTWSPRCSSRTSTGPVSPERPGSFCSSGPSTGLQKPRQPPRCDASVSLQHLSSSTSQFHGDQGPDPAQRRQLRFLPPDSPAVRRVHVLPGGTSRGSGYGRDAHRRDGGDETSGMDSDLDEDADDSGEPLAKREKSEHEVIQVIQVGALEDGSHPVVGVVQPGVLHSLPQPQNHTEHILSPSSATPTIRHCSATGNTYASV
ncbi:unnamed protein product [Tetraodon nigroviridis]|uniref:Transcription factor RFX3 n=1 Tax=Tetraodon nigroviridis TaxID=99883 RepID=Q4SJG3_TETNG|nr:unnamed protein product [Tetraodon nigroviridis]